MLNAVSSVSDVKVSDAVVSRAAPAPAAPAPAPVAAKVDSNAPLPISPSIHQDAQSGAIVTQFVSSDGDVSQQVPSAAALAYLRAGLTAQGSPTKEEGAI